MSGIIAKTFMSNGKRFTVIRDMLTASFARDQRWPYVVAGISTRFSKFPFVLFCYITSNLMTGPLGNLFPSDLHVSPDDVSGNIEILGKLFPSCPVIKC